jgi:hypothetical protein
MATSFKVELEELEAVRLKLQALLHDHFQAPASPLTAGTYHNNTASDMMQTAAPMGLKRADANDGSSNFGPTNQGLDAASKLNFAHGQVQQAHELYSTTEGNLRLDITQVQKGA